MYMDGPGLYMCVAEVQCYIRALAGTASFAGSDPTGCEAAGVPYAAARAVRHRPLRLALCKLWLGQGCSRAMGAAGCNAEMRPTTMIPPDMVAVTNMTESTPLIAGSGLAVLRQRHNRRYYGHYLVDVNTFVCQLGPTNNGSRNRCFLVCSKLSGK